MVAFEGVVPAYGPYQAFVASVRWLGALILVFVFNVFPLSFSMRRRLAYEDYPPAVPSRRPEDFSPGAL